MASSVRRISAICTWGHKVIVSADPGADCPAPVWRKYRSSNDVDALRHWRTAVMFSLMSLKCFDVDGLDAVIKEGQLPQGTDLPYFKIGI